MNKKPGLFLATVLVIVHTLSVWHMAEHGFCKHEHNGRQCDIGLAFEQSKNLSNSTPSTLPKITYFLIKNYPSNDVAVKAHLYTSLQPRAPPAHILLVT